jgi:hypothetical protein
MQIARLFDGIDPSGEPFFAPDRPRIADPALRARIADFLGSGKVIRRSGGFDTDRIEPSRGRVVPTSSHTDGTWIWNEALRYYVLTHGIAPEDEFLAHIIGRGYQAAMPDEPAWREALAVLRASQR